MDSSYAIGTTAEQARLRPAALRRTWPLAIALLVIAVIASGFCFTDHGRPAVISALVLPDMMLSLPVRPVTWVTAEPRVEHTNIDYGSGRIRADIYRPGDNARHPAVIFSMGAPPLDLDDPRLEKLAEDAARMGLVMVVPFSERLDAEEVDPAEIDALVGIYQYLEDQPYVRADKIGYIGVSVGGALAIVAAEDPRIADRVDFVVSFGGYLDAFDTFVAIASHGAAYGDDEVEWDPDPHSVEVEALQIIRLLPDADDKRVLCRAFVDSWDYDLCDLPIDRAPLSEAEIARLTPQGRAAYEAMTTRDPDEARVKLGQVPNLVRRLELVSPDVNLDRLRAEVFIIHDKGDKFVPYVESRRLRDALTGREDVHFSEVSLFEHVEPRLGRGGDIIVLDSSRLYFRLYQLLLKLT